MQVAYFQIFILASVAFAYWLQPIAAMILAAAWTLFTLAEVNTARLAIVQLSTIWGTYLVMRFFALKDAQISAKEREIAELRDQLKSDSPEIAKRLKGMSSFDIEVIAGPEHKAVLFSALKDAQEALYLFSGWISKNVLNPSMMKLLEEALERGVKIAIGYGFKSYPEDTVPTQSEQEALEALRLLFKTAREKKWPGSLRVVKFDNHEKLIVQDDSLVACGSHNWLSNWQFKNSERSLIVRSSDFVEKERARVEQVVAQQWQQQRQAAKHGLEGQSQAD